MAISGKYNVDELLLQIATGDEVAFAALFDSYWPGVYAHILSFLKDAGLAEEVSQDIFIKLWDVRATLGAVNDFRSYLFIATRNRIFSELRKKKTLLEDTTLDHLTATALQPDEQLRYKEFYSQVMDAIEQLPARKKEVFKMSRLEHLSRKEIAAQTGLTYGTVNQYLIDATVFIRNRLKTFTVTTGLGILYLLWLGR